MKFRIGRHINISHGFITAPSYAKSIGCNIMQIFLGAPQRILSKEKSESELKKFAEELKKNGMRVTIHAAYTINLCHPRKNKQYQDSIKSLVRDLMASSIIGKRCLGVVIHMGKNIPANNITDDKALTNYIIGLKEALAKAPENTTIILETGASQGSEIASKIDGLAEIYWGLEEEERNRITFCIDTCHIWASGYDISTKAGVLQFFKQFDKKIGIDKISCIHFNDSKTNLNSNVDRHADLGYGYIKTPGLKAFAQFAKKHRIPIIMETPLDAVNPKTNRDVTFHEEFEKLKNWLDIKHNE